MLTIGATEINRVAVIGLGLSGRSCVRFLLQQGIEPDLYDTRLEFDDAPLRALWPSARIQRGPLRAELLGDYQLLLVSPGIAVAHPAIQAAAERGGLIWGDVQLFAHFAAAPIIGITGSNGKTTVTSLVGEMAKEAGLKVAVGGNIGVPALDLLADEVQLYVLELSSFQLETTHHLPLVAATVLNLCEDHLDRYQGLEAYADAKQRIYQHARWCLSNRDDPLTPPRFSVDKTGHVDSYSFGSDKPRVMDEWGLYQSALWRGNERLLAVSELGLIGRHNQLNVLAALALGDKAGVPMAAMLATLRRFRGLPHRCQLVSERGGIRWLNDSKATNVGATLAALEGLADHPGHLLLIAGGDAKGADLSSLQPLLRERVEQLIVLGRDGEALAALVDNPVRVDSLEAAVERAAALAKDGDIVLLSPACASIDMFSDYRQRGDCFCTAVEALDA